MHSMQRPEVFFSVHRLLPGFELQTSNVPKQQMETPANRRTPGEVTASNAQHYKLVHRRIGVHRRIDYHQSAYQIPTFNTTDWYTGELAYTGESITLNRRIRFQRSTQQIGTPANRRTQANRLPSIGVSDSNVQHNRLVHRRIGVHRRIDYHQSAYQIPTFNTTDWYTGESAYTGESITINRRIRFQRSRRQNRLVHRRMRTYFEALTGDRRVNPYADSNVQQQQGWPYTGFQLGAFGDHSVRTSRQTSDVATFNTSSPGTPCESRRYLDRPAHSALRRRRIRYPTDIVIGTEQLI